MRFFFVLMIRRPPRSTLFPYTTALPIYTIGGVISPAEPVMNIVPVNDKLELEAKVLPHEIDQVKLGQKATVKVHAADRKSTRLNSSHANISYAVFCLKKTKTCLMTTNTL